MSISLKVKGLEAVAKATKQLDVELRKELNNQFKAFGDLVQNEAKALAPADEGNLRNSIVIKEGDLSVSVFSRLEYAAYLEFGTRKFAAAYVNTLPQDWQTYAATFKGGGGSSIGVLEVLLAWAKRKGIPDEEAYGKVIGILINGIKARPFLYPAFNNNLKAFEARLKNITK